MTPEDLVKGESVAYPDGSIIEQWGYRFDTWGPWIEETFVFKCGIPGCLVALTEGIATLPDARIAYLEHMLTLHIYPELLDYRRLFLGRA
jgi:hypothetical protein